MQQIINNNYAGQIVDPVEQGPQCFGRSPGSVLHRQEEGVKTKVFGKARWGAMNLCKTKCERKNSKKALNSLSPNFRPGKKNGKKRQAETFHQPGWGPHRVFGIFLLPCLLKMKKANFLKKVAILIK